MIWRVILFIVIIATLTFGVFLFIANRTDYSQGEPAWGVTFSPVFAEELGLPPHDVFTAMLDDLRVSHVRLPGYWSGIEKTPGEFDFSDLDWYVSEAAARNVKIILVLGQRQPRWPECYFPAWVKNLPAAVRQDRTLKFISEVVRRYQNNGAIVYWQVENEPLLDFFGECPAGDLEFLKREIDLVKSLDERPVMVTESGELSTWMRTAGLVDVLGVSLYRTTYNRYFGYFYYPLTPSFYHNKITLIIPLVQKVICSELQAEPWAPDHINKMTLDQMHDAMTVETIKTNADFARRSGFSEIYLWGVEWWYYMDEKFDDPTYWNAMKEFWKK
ncbi:MAG: hypothetical protein PHW53_04565 [Patescibacteria group bacterium]|nr:hypothetical protein [Patescibacteria group bacterium]